MLRLRRYFASASPSEIDSSVTVPASELLAVSWPVPAPGARPRPPSTIPDDSVSVSVAEERDGRTAVVLSCHRIVDTGSYRLPFAIGEMLKSKRGYVSLYGRGWSLVVRVQVTTE